MCPSKFKMLIQAKMCALVRLILIVVLGSYQIPGYATNTWVSLRLRASGSSLSVDVDGVTRISASDGSFASGQAGVWSYQPGSARAHSFDDFTIVQLGASIGGSKALAKPAKRAVQQGGTPVITSYYYFNGQRVAMRKDGVVTWLHGDHLGSASVATNSAGGVMGQMRYTPYGSERWSVGSLPTDRRFTGYAREKASYVGALDFAQARYYSPYLGRFVSADTIIQALGDPQTLNRYSYTRNNPLKYVDPSGHCFIFAGLDTLACVGLWMMIGGGGIIALDTANKANPQVAANAERALGDLIESIPLNIAPTSPPHTAHTNAPEINASAISGYPLASETNSSPFTTPLSGSSTVQMNGPLTSAYEVAKSGGKHEGLLKKWEGEGTRQIRKTIKSLESNIQDHQGWIANPHRKWKKEWDSFDEARRQREIGHWEDEIRGWDEQIDILNEILR